MNGGRKQYIRAFMAMIGMVLAVTGIVGGQFLGKSFVVGYFFIIIGLILIAIPIYWWYKDYQKGV